MRNISAPQRSHRTFSLASFGAGNSRGIVGRWLGHAAIISLGPGRDVVECTSRAASCKNAYAPTRCGRSASLTSDLSLAARLRMVDEQVYARGVRDPRVLDALRTVPRHEFVPSAERAHAYEDRPLGIGAGQTISQPYMVAIMTVALGLSPGDRVLEIGTGSGYQTAVLAALAAEVISIERVPELAARAQETLGRLGFANVSVQVGDGSLGWPTGHGFDGILVTAGAPDIPESLCSQLAESGRLVVPVGSRTHQELVIVQRDGEEFREEWAEGCLFVPLVGRFGWNA